MKGENEKLLYEALNEAYPGQWEREVKGIEGRKFRFDCANPKLKIAIEINGGIWLPKGGHNTGISLEKDMEKLNLAVLAGWRVLQYSPQTLRNTPFKIIRDVRMLCGTSTNDAEQAELCFDNVKLTMQMQRKLN